MAKPRARHDDREPGLLYLIKRVKGAYQKNSRERKRVSGGAVGLEPGVGVFLKRKRRQLGCPGKQHAFKVQRVHIQPGPQELLRHVDDDVA